jgi:hypothetical protein
MKFNSENFPTVDEIRRAAEEFVDEHHVGVWPEDDWFDIGRNWSVNVWQEEGRQRITVYPDRIDGQGFRTTDALFGINIDLEREPSIRPRRTHRHRISRSGLR